MTAMRDLAPILELPTVLKNTPLIERETNVNRNIEFGTHSRGRSRDILDWLK